MFWTAPLRRISCDLKSVALPDRLLPPSSRFQERRFGVASFSRRVVTPEGLRPAAVLVDGERIRAIVELNYVPTNAVKQDFGDAALLPGLVDSHVHINEPGRTDWEGFRTAMLAAAAGGYTMLVDMPLNCLPATTNVAALQAKRRASQGQCRVDWAAWGGVVPDSPGEIEALADAGVRGFKCFLVHPGIDEFTWFAKRICGRRCHMSPGRGSRCWFTPSFRSGGCSD